ncbi:MAG: autotransporter-associated beta strand repeat-containing protein [Verrucomicrobiales bacterium]|nr:autotransporter-associated beta strand repeat-containing protein [Verrucomicrobiales bacterium]
MTIGLAWGHLASAASFTWDPASSGTGSDGNGVWDNSAAFWSNGSGDQVWTSGTDSLLNSAIFGKGGVAGSVTVNGSQWVQSMTFNAVSSGTYVITGGTIFMNGSGAGITAANNTNVELNSTFGASGTFGLAAATFSVGSGGSLTLSGGAVIANNQNLQLQGAGTYYITGGTYNAVSGNFTYWIKSNVVQSAGSVNAGTAGGGGTTWIGYGGDSVYTLTGTSASLTTGILAISRGNVGMFDLKQGLVTVSSTLVRIGTDNAGTLTVEGGTFNATNAVANINEGAATKLATANIQGGLTQLKGIQFGGVAATTFTTGSAVLNMSSGTLNLGANGITNAYNGTLTTKTNLSGGVIGMISGVSAWTSTVDMNLSTGVNGNVSFKPDVSGTITLQGKLTGSGGFDKLGAGTLLLTAANDYQGGTVVSAGILRTDMVGTLGAGDVFVGSVGTLSLGNNLSINNLADLSFDLGAVIQLGYDGTLTLNSLSMNGVYMAAGLHSIDELNNFFGGTTFQQVSGFASEIYISSIPEPSALALLLLGMSVMAVGVRKRFLS